jgi:hypothetical protein
MWESVEEEKVYKYKPLHRSRIYPPKPLISYIRQRENMNQITI